MIKLVVRRLRCHDSAKVSFPSPEKMLVGSNQIKTVFDPEYERYINLEGYDRIRQYYLRPDDCASDDDSSF
jgi:hypothetical protein